MRHSAFGDLIGDHDRQPSLMGRDSTATPSLNVSLMAEWEAKLAGNGYEESSQGKCDRIGGRPLLDAGAASQNIGSATPR